jgi:hypothetical protein
MMIARFKFNTIEGQYLDEPYENIQIDNRAILYPVGANTINQAKKYEVLIKNINNEMEAIELGKKYKNAFKLAFANLLIGADFGMSLRNSSGGISKFLNFMENSEGLFKYDNENDLLIYDENSKPKLMQIEVSGKKGKKTNDLNEKIIKYLEYPLLDTKKEIAYDLFSVSFLLPSAYSQLVVLTMAIEFMSKPIQLEANEIQFIKNMKSISMNSELLDNDHKKYYSDLIGYWEESSIRKRCISLVEEIPNRDVYGSSNRKFFNAVYSMRSDLVHGSSKNIKDEKYNSVIFPLQIMVTDLICRSN